MLLCTGRHPGTDGSPPLWAVLLGAAAFTGAYEFTYNAAPPEILSTSLSIATSLLLSVGVGWLAVSWLAPEPLRRRLTGPAQPTPRRRHETVPLDKMMETKR